MEMAAANNPANDMNSGGGGREEGSPLAVETAELLPAHSQ